MNEKFLEWLMTPGADHLLTLQDFLGRPAWHSEALCRGQGPALFVRGPTADYGALRELSDVCPVRQECLAALVDESLVGLWGGTDERERRAMRRRRQVA